MTAQQRRERADELARRFAAEVAGVASPGLGSWRRAWEIAGPATDGFGAALLEWEVEGRPELVGDVEERYRTAVDAWSRASRAFHREVRR